MMTEHDDDADSDADAAHDVDEDEAEYADEGDTANGKANGHCKW